MNNPGEVKPGHPSDEPEDCPESTGPILALEYDSAGAQENTRFVHKEMKRLQLLENQYKQRSFILNFFRGGGDIVYAFNKQLEEFRQNLFCLISHPSLCL